MPDSYTGTHLINNLVMVKGIYSNERTVASVFRLGSDAFPTIGRTEKNV